MAQMPQVTRRELKQIIRQLCVLLGNGNICITGGGALGAWNPYGGANQARVEMVDHLGFLEPEVIEIEEQC